MSNFEQENREFNPIEMENFLRDAFDHEFGESPHVELQVTNTAFGQRIREFELVNFGYLLIEDFLSNSFKLFETQIVEALRQFTMIKTIAYFSADFERAFKIDEQSEPLFEKRLIYIPTKMKEIDLTTNISEYFQNDIINYLKKKVDEAMVEGSGFTLGKINKLTIQIFKYEPLRGSGFVELPKKLKQKGAIINLKNTKEECFKWSILAALHHTEVCKKSKNKGNDALSYRMWSNELNFDGIEFPVQLNQIEKFMQLNERIAVNVYYFNTEKNHVYPLYLAQKSFDKQYVHLLLLTEQTESFNIETHKANVNSHYCWIKNLGKLVGGQVSKCGHKLSFCDRCLNHFTTQEKLENHKISCAMMNNCAIEMPTRENNYVSFKNFKNQLKVPYIIYADTEALLKEPASTVYSLDCSTQAHQHHEVHSIGYYFKSENDESKSRYASHRGENCLEWFINELIEIATWVFDILEDKKPMITLTEEEEKSFYESTICHICKRSLINIDDVIKFGVPVKDHCHISGQYRGAAHQSCNLQYQISRNIPVIMHNLSGYDSHLLIRKLGSERLIPGEITIIPNNAEKYISFIKTMRGVDMENEYARTIKFKFIDSLCFMKASLDYLAKILPDEKKQILKSECIKSDYCSDEMFALLNRKGVFPYEYIDDYNKLNEKKLPPIKSFYSSLTESTISDADYIHAQNVWQKFNIRSIGEYSDLYLKTDVLLLADVFENFRSTCIDTYSLDPAHYFGAPGLTFDAMLKYTGVSIELFTDVDMLMFVEGGIRGGVSQINKRYVKANNIYMGDEFDASKETSYIMYLDGK